MAGSLRQFVRESNLIEGIHREPTDIELAVHDDFLLLIRPRHADLENFVRQVAGAELRRKEGMCVRVGSHYPPPGCSQMAAWLEDLLETAYVGAQTAYEIHVRYEKLHPFMDGNGRSGRALWARQMAREGHDPFALPFLHRFYYQSLEASRAGEPC